MTRRNFSIVYKFLIILSIILGVGINLIKTTSIISMISYYTIQSNIICLISYIYFVYIEIRKKAKEDRYYIIKGAITIAILITGIIYRFALIPNNFQMDVSNTISSNDISNIIVHTISPVMVLLDYILFDEKGHLKLYYSLCWLFIPIGYGIYVYIYGGLGGKFYSIGGSERFAYFFLDYIQIGIKKVIAFDFCIIGFVLLISFLLVCIDKIMDKINNEEPLS